MKWLLVLIMSSGAIAYREEPSEPVCEIHREQLVKRMDILWWMTPEHPTYQNPIRFSACVPAESELAQQLRDGMVR